MTDYLDEIQARADAATGGPWEAYDERAELADASPLWVLGRMDVRGDWMHDVADVGRDPQDRANAEFIAHARTDVPRLVAALRAVEALCAEARAGLSIPPIDCTGSCSDGPCDCSGVFRVRAWDLDPDRIRTAIRDALEAR